MVLTLRQTQKRHRLHRAQLFRHTDDEKMNLYDVVPGGAATGNVRGVSQRYITGGDEYAVEERQEMAANASPLYCNEHPDGITQVVGFLARKEADWPSSKFVNLNCEAV